MEEILLTDLEKEVNGYVYPKINFIPVVPKDNSNGITALIAKTDIINKQGYVLQVRMQFSFAEDEVLEWNSEKFAEYRNIFTDDIITECERIRSRTFTEEEVERTYDGYTLKILKLKYK